ncbi:DUF4260 domain-containing protein [Algoriphagus sp. AK58]|uniref:DUF4260 domain-containing protein n=1 Tax=Algoriphagus sp. AK58 TaxID=1406877 RepID=UPI00165001A4|nr:DUF4260 domain-containing protein [Algoriphagus sp. AK58]MBC6366267.1 DUF4260 domain-containing protein [Algoriphagus sp. AK58]
MNRLLKLEEIGLFILGLVAFHWTGVSWWWFAGLILLPDIGMLGYLVNEKIGARTYNLFHHRAIAIMIFGLGFFLNSHLFEIAGIILFSHIAMDRIFGYGLKYEKGFKFTHLGEIGKK